MLLRDAIHDLMRLGGMVNSGLLVAYCMKTSFIDRVFRINRMIRHYDETPLRIAVGLHRSTVDDSFPYLIYSLNKLSYHFDVLLNPCQARATTELGESAVMNVSSRTIQGILDELNLCSVINPCSKCGHADFVLI